MKINVKNVSALIHFMDGLVTNKFDMASFKHGCGTPSCALGWACEVPELRAAGMNILTIGTILGEGHNQAWAVFGDVYDDLFDSKFSKRINSPQQWSSHARAFLKKHGYEVMAITTTQESDFKRFMDTVLAPRPELQGLPLELPAQ